MRMKKKRIKKGKNDKKKWITNDNYVAGRR